MKNLFMLLFLTLPLIIFASDIEFDLSSEIHQNNTLDFIPHHGNGELGSYMAMTINYKPMAELYSQVVTHENIPLKTRGEAHITVVTPKDEYYDVLRKKISIDEIDRIALEHDIQSSDLEIICLGKGTVKNNNKIESTFFIVVKSQNLLDIRHAIKKLYIERGGNPDKFNPDHYYPHITLGFTSRDLHESDGVIKDSNSCFAGLNY